MSKYQEENNALARHFLDRTFYRGFKDEDNANLENFRAIEFIFSYYCNLACQYCYVARHNDSLYPPELYYDRKTVLHNLGMVCDWMVENNYNPHIEIFSGEPLVQSVVLDGLDLILDKLGDKIETRMLVPTNFTFLLYPKLVDRVERIVERSHDVGVPIGFSASFDGKYCEVNRPFASNYEGGQLDSVGVWQWNKVRHIPDPRDDDYYDRAFTFAKKHKCGFHPMIYSENVHLWKKNWLWFQEMFTKYGLRWDGIYLLEVRNPEWTPQQCRDLSDFVNFLVKWTWNKTGKSIDNYARFVGRNRGFNLLGSVMNTVGRGIGCSIQGTMMLRLGDLALVPCHRTSYDHLIYGHMDVKNGKVTGDLNTRNIEAMLGTYTFQSMSQPYCEQCTIKNLCKQGCLGAQYEVFGDPFTPIPTMCRMEHAKALGIVEAYNEIGILPWMIETVNDAKKNDIKALCKIAGIKI